MQNFPHICIYCTARSYQLHNMGHSVLSGTMRKIMKKWFVQAISIGVIFSFITSAATMKTKLLLCVVSSYCNAQVTTQSSQNDPFPNPLNILQHNSYHLIEFYNIDFP
ncbi:hypothetical protein IscW_ISCW001385 [Ixodes scapularis]|uniref:Uncharacterized protein n=1 Tax=Ixodes scapularis TaxID=6945 RepID=B7P5F0_IXOSC|nr:hypothetical protein IscW_ISCW001385 [Ixodes scapularis]|eukprot:XP_002407314.1 hypothetical protein IscW_ISCW001385 [Ixodes scapularis]